MNEWMNEKFIILSDAFINDNSVLDLGKSAQQKLFVLEMHLRWDCVLLFILYWYMYNLII